MLKKLLGLFVLMAVVSGGAQAAQMFSGTAPVNVTSDTAATAKNIALDSARRQIIRESLASYADKTALAALVKSASASELANLIVSSSIDGEQQSATTYSANITMTVDGGAAQKWLAANGVQNWLSDGSGGNQIPVLITLRDRVGDWMALNRMARGENIDLNTRSIGGGQMTVEIPESARAKFVAAARASGWQVSSDDGALRLWK